MDEVNYISIETYPQGTALVTSHICRTALGECLFHYGRVIYSKMSGENVYSIRGDVPKISDLFFALGILFYYLSRHPPTDFSMKE